MTWDLICDYVIQDTVNANNMRSVFLFVMEWISIYIIVAV